PFRPRARGRGPAREPGVPHRRGHHRGTVAKQADKPPPDGSNCVEGWLGWYTPFAACSRIIFEQCGLH
ncbi:hypothetical protein, partial [Paenibacillus barengoltzii]|uniref:hypothetical protein n=1 Tax=Paenibacillus barengoltzii TaxID=343517 RepID=UPI002FDA3C45